MKQAPYFIAILPFISPRKISNRAAGALAMPKNANGFASVGFF